MSQSIPWIFLRGLTRDGRHWGDFPRIFQQRIPDASIIQIDLPGNGALHRESSPPSIEAMAAYCRAELHRRGIPPPYRVLAMSLGAMVAVAWAATHPREIESCVLINTSLRPHSPFHRRLRPSAYPSILRMLLARTDARGSEEAILRLTSRHRERTRAVLDQWTAWRQEQPVSRANALRQLLAAMKFRAPAVAPAARLLLLTSKRDALVDTRCSRQLARLWRCDIAEHPDAGHDLPLDDGEWVVRQIQHWI